MRNLLLRNVGWGLCAALVCLPPTARGQEAQPAFDLQGLNANVIGRAGRNEKPVAVEASFNVAPGAQTGELAITAKIDKGWHIYSITQKRGGPIRTQIKLPKSDDYKLTGEFKPSPAPKSHVDAEIWPDLPLEEHYDRVTWTAPIEIAAGLDPAGLEISGKVFLQACERNCLPPEDLPFTAHWEKPAEKPAAGAAAAESYTTDEISFRGHLEPKVAAPGGKVKLVLTAEPAEGWHVYELGRPQEKMVSHPTLIVVTDAAGLEVGKTTPDVDPQHEGDNAVAQYDEPVSWTTELTVPHSAQPGELKLSGLLAYQVCTAANCLRPAAVGFEATLTVDFNSAEGVEPVNFTGKASYREAQEVVASREGEVVVDQIVPPATAAAGQPLWWMLGIAFAGGLILNLMPCVLPVIGLKVLSFVEQSGRDRRHVFLLNVWYSLGLLAVFMILATLPVISRLWFGRQFGWGEQFSFYQFNIAMAAIVFVMALSFLGVWEIPIPGFVGGAKANELTAQEGVAGAFCKGAVTTLLATPCSGPFLGTALAFAFSQPAQITYAMFACIGLGMASPYLLIGAFPALIRFLPKPGAWMDTFKQLMGFVLLGTVVYLMSLVPADKVISTFAFLVGLWAACWWIGRTPLYAEFGTKLRAWGVGAVIAGAVGVFSFVSMGEGEKLPWQPFSMAELDRLTREEKTVMVDFTADWCVTCRALERFILNTAETKEFVTSHGIVPLVADMTEYPPEESDLLRRLSGGKAVPVLAIFPAGRPQEPIVLVDSYTKGILLDKLKEAGPSKGAGASKNATAMIGAK